MVGLESSTQSLPRPSLATRWRNLEAARLLRLGSLFWLLFDPPGVCLVVNRGGRAQLLQTAQQREQE